MLGDVGFTDLADLDDFGGRLVAAASSASARSITGAAGFPRGLCTWAAQAGGELLSEHGFGT